MVGSLRFGARGLCLCLCVCNGIVKHGLSFDWKYLVVGALLVLMQAEVQHGVSEYSNDTGRTRPGSARSPERLDRPGGTVGDDWRGGVIPEAAMFGSYARTTSKH